jgi:hypothetical protein
VHGAVPTTIARSLHDSLELLGYTGWLDVDKLSVISAEEMASAIGRSAAMVVLLNDETHLSQWCTHEWEVAAERGIPCQVVVDMERCSKAAGLQAVSAHPHLLKYQWLEMTERHRRECLAEVRNFLEGVIGDADAADDLACDSALRIGTDAQLPKVMHDVFEAVLVFGGIPFRTPRWAASRAWCAFVVCGRLACLAVCVVRMVYATGPAFTDVQSVLAVVLYHAFAFYCPLHLIGVLSRPSTRRMLASLNDSTSREVAERLHVLTRRAGIAICTFNALFMVVTYAGFVPLFFDQYYIGADAHAWDKAFGWTSGFAFLIFIPPIAFSWFASFGLMHLLLCLGTLKLEAAFDALDPRVAELGLRRFVDVERRLQLSAASLVDFQANWNAGIRSYEEVQRELAPAQALAFVSSGIGLLLPLHLLAIGFTFDSGVAWPNAIRLLLIWGGPPGALTFVCTLLPAVHCTECLRRLRALSAQLVLQNPTHRLFISHIVDSAPLTCSVARLLPADRPAVVATAVVLVASVIPWCFIDFWGFTPARAAAAALDGWEHPPAGDVQSSAAPTRLAYATLLSCVAMVMYFVVRARGKVAPRAGAQSADGAPGPPSGSSIVHMDTAPWRALMEESMGKGRGAALH